jgi:HlyD family secretion protein
MTKRRTRSLPVLLVVLVAVAGYFAWQRLGIDGLSEGIASLVRHWSESSDLPEGIGSGNEHMEATEIDVASKTSGRIREILVNEGDFVAAGQVLSPAWTPSSSRPSGGRLRRSCSALIGIDTAKSLVTQRGCRSRALRPKRELSRWRPIARCALHCS